MLVKITEFLSRSHIIRHVSGGRQLSLSLKVVKTQNQLRLIMDMIDFAKYGDIEDPLGFLVPLFTRKTWQ
ncbi:hypothetical protein PB1E_0593 [Leuconostoc gelidum subsp. gasicomitatum]|nr:hypothetical protein PB1E_0593 [Leuconostoc gasicomitatum]